jgi:prepilin peptidase CpaA
MFGHLMYSADSDTVPEGWYVTAAVLIPFVLVASYVDYAQRKVPNIINGTLLLLGISAQMIWFGGWGLLNAALGVVAGFVPLFLVWMMRGMGAGDVKLMAAIGAWMGWELCLWSFAIGAILGGLIALVMIVVGKRLDSALVNLRTIGEKMSDRKTVFSDFGSVESFGATTQKLPYGVPLTMGTLIVLACESPALKGQLPVLW